MSDSSHAAFSDPASDPHLHCMECDYDLTGVPEDRCPECGLAQARSRMQAWMNWGDLKPPFGNLPPVGGDRPIWIASLFQPGELGRRLPPNVDETQIKSHLWLMRGLTFAITFLSVAVQMRGDGESILFGVVISWSIWVGAVLCERVAASLLRVLARDTRAPGPRLWLNLVRCHATFLPLSIVMFQVFLFSRTIRIWTRIYFGTSLGFVPLTTGLLPPLLWWCINVTLAFRARTGAGPRCLVIGISMLLTAAVSIAGGFFTGVVLTLFVGSMVH